MTCQELDQRLTQIFTRGYTYVQRKERHTFLTFLHLAPSRKQERIVGFMEALREYRYNVTLDEDLETVAEFAWWSEKYTTRIRMKIACSGVVTLVLSEPVCMGKLGVRWQVAREVTTVQAFRRYIVTKKKEG